GIGQCGNHASVGAEREETEIDAATRQKEDCAGSRTTGGGADQRTRHGEVRNGREIHRRNSSQGNPWRLSTAGAPPHSRSAPGSTSTTHRCCCCRSRQENQTLAVSSQGHCKIRIAPVEPAASFFGARTHGHNSRRAGRNTTCLAVTGATGARPRSRSL